MARDRTTNTGTWERGGPLTAYVLVDMIHRCRRDTERYRAERERVMERTGWYKRQLEVDRLDRCLAQTAVLEDRCLELLQRFAPPQTASAEGPCIPKCTIDKWNQ